MFTIPFYMLIVLRYESKRNGAMRRRFNPFICLRWCDVGIWTCLWLNTVRNCRRMMMVSEVKAMRQIWSVTPTASSLRTSESFTRHGDTTWAAAKRRADWAPLHLQTRQLFTGACALDMLTSSALACQQSPSSDCITRSGLKRVMFNISYGDTQDSVAPQERLMNY